MDNKIDDVDVTTAEHFIAARFDVTFVGPDAESGSSGVVGGGVDEIGDAAVGCACAAECDDEVVV